MAINKVNKNVCVPNIYRLYDRNRKFLMEVAIETPNYEIVKLFKVGNTYYMHGGGWRLYETKCVMAPKK